MIHFSAEMKDSDDALWQQLSSADSQCKNTGDTDSLLQLNFLPNENFES